METLRLYSVGVLFYVLALCGKDELGHYFGLTAISVLSL